MNKSIENSLLSFELCETYSLKVDNENKIFIDKMRGDNNVFEVILLKNKKLITLNRKEIIEYLENLKLKKYVFKFENRK